jgi:uncharacterized protein YdcH (DUF465 family)
LKSLYAYVTVGLSRVPEEKSIHPNEEELMMMKKEEEIKDHLMSSNPDFRRLVEEHRLYEGKLHELHNRHHLTEQDHLEEVQLKKKKLHLKDQMNSMILKFRKELSHQAS